MIGIILVFVTVAVSSGLMVTLLIRLAHSKSWYDRTSERGVHSGNVPRLGGLGFVPVFAVTALVIMFTLDQVDSFARFALVIAGACAIVVFGVWDDFRPLRPIVKLLIQIGAALCVVASGYVFSYVAFFDESLMMRFPWIGYVITVFWLVGMTNAVNLIDGVDALAGGISFIVALTFAYIFSAHSGVTASVMICIALAGSIAGFLVFNAPLPKARIFMGDGGSQFLGFTLALLPLLEGRNTIATMPILYVAAILAIPIFDTTAAVWRRARDRKPLSSPDRSHIHHKLMNLGLNARKIDAVMLSLQAVVSILVIVSLKLAELPTRWQSLTVLGFAYAVVIAFFTVLHFMNSRRTKGTGESDTDILNAGDTPLPPTERLGQQI